MTTLIQDFKDWKKAKNNVATIRVVLHDACNVESSTCKAYPCFYDSVKKEHFEDITIYEIVCGDCIKFNTLLQLQDAQEKQQTAKHKLLDNFRFWKQK